MTFYRVHKLKSRKVIGELFTSGKSSFVYPVKILFISRDSSDPCQVEGKTCVKGEETSEDSYGSGDHTPVIHWMEKETSKSIRIQYAVVAPKKIYRKAVDRNRIKRQMRAALTEVLKTHLASSGKHTDMMLIYIGREMLPYSTILKSTHKQIKKIL